MFEEKINNRKSIDTDLADSDHIHETRINRRAHEFVQQTR